MENHIFPFLWMREQSEDVLRTEMEKIYECGIRAVCLESRPHPDFMGEQWWHDFDIILDECHKKDMKIWILDDAHFPTGQANGLIPGKYPERARKYGMMQFTDCVGPLEAVDLDVNLMMTKRFLWTDFGKQIDKPLIDKQELISVTASRLIENDQISSDIIDLTSLVDEDGWLHWDVPEGVWRICVSFTTYDFGWRNDYINYIDELSVSTLIEAVYEPHFEKYKDEFGKTIAGFFSDEPGFYNVSGYQMNNPIGRTKMPVPWCDEMEQMLENSNSNWRVTFPLLWLSSDKEDEEAAARYRYMDYASRLYEKNFSRQLGKWCEDHNVEYIGHVIEDYEEHSHLGNGAAHFFRAMAGQHMAGIDNIGGCIVPGNALGARHGVTADTNGKFYHYGFIKMGASSAQTDPMKKGRYMCETYGAYGWNYGVKSFKWISDYLLFQGVNYFVPHAFSMADYPDMDCPPHFYARGNNPQFPYFAELMKYVNRMCELFSNGKNVPSTAIIYPGEADWMSECMKQQDIMMELMNSQIDCEVLATDIFSDREYYGVSMKNGVLTVNERTMKSIIVPYTPFLDARLVDVIADAVENGIRVIFINEKPDYIVDPVYGNKKVSDELDGCVIVSLSDLCNYLIAEGLADKVLSKADKDVLFYQYEKGNSTIRAYFNTSLSRTVRTFAYSLDLPYVRYDGMTNTAYEFGGTDIVLRPYESIVLISGELPEGAKLVSRVELKKEEIASCDCIDISDNWSHSRVKAINYPDFGATENLERLVPISRIDPAFSGIMRYEKIVELSKKGEMFFTADSIYENAELFVNGKSAGKIITPDYIWNITDLVSDGNNSFVVEVANTPSRDAFQIPSIFGPEREVIEPSGMFGKVLIVSK